VSDGFLIVAIEGAGLTLFIFALLLGFDTDRKLAGIVRDLFVLVWVDGLECLQFIRLLFPVI
jgi:hypothetical protein